jgi:formylglycine-generating enzyme required for sulfatase activity
MNDDANNDLHKRQKLQQLLSQGANNFDSDEKAFLVESLADQSINIRKRVQIGELLSKIGDPRISTPESDDYWSLVTRKGISLYIGRFMVTNAEWKQFVSSEKYSNDDYWCEDGIIWRDSERPSWQQLASGDDVEQLICDNQPVVGVSWFEAQAYARASGARLLESIERAVLVRGDEKRPYPWGDPFGRSNANTAEEALGRPCAVGLFSNDRVPEPVFDLAGNVAEWTSTGEKSKKAYHPGSWKQPSMAAWAKAIQLISPSARSDELGFRLAKNS